MNEWRINSWSLLAATGIDAAHIGKGVKEFARDKIKDWYSDADDDTGELDYYSGLLQMVQESFCNCNKRYLINQGRRVFGESTSIQV